MKSTVRFFIEIVPMGTYWTSNKITICQMPIQYCQMPIQYRLPTDSDRRLHKPLKRMIIIDHQTREMSDRRCNY